MSAVVLQPRSATNPGADYVVVDYYNWLDHVNNKTRLHVLGRHKTANAAAYEQEKINK